MTRVTRIKQFKNIWQCLSTYITFFNPFLANVPTLYPLKTPENLCFLGVFRGYKMGTLGRNGLMERLNFFISQGLRYSIQPCERWSRCVCFCWWWWFSSHVRFTVSNTPYELLIGVLTWLRFDSRWCEKIGKFQERHPWWNKFLIKFQEES